MVGRATVSNLLVIAMLAGCTGDPSNPAAQPANSAADPCPTEGAPGGIPGWAVLFGGRWGNVAEAAGHMDVLCGAGGSVLAGLVWVDGGNFTDFEATISINLLSGGAGAGLIFHVQDAGNLQMVRYSPRHQNWALFTMEGGVRHAQEGANVTGPTTHPTMGDWSSLRVRSQGGHVMAFDGDTMVIDFQLGPAAVASGYVGVFLREDAAALFDGLHVVAL